MVLVFLMRSSAENIEEIHVPVVLGVVVLCSADLREADL